MLSPVLVTPPDDTPLSVAEARQHSRIDDDEDDALVQALIQAATDHLDGWTGILGRCLMPQTWRQDFGGFASKLRLPLRPVREIASVKYYDSDNQEQTLDSSVYVLRADATGPYAELRPDQEWPNTYDRADAVSVSFVAGYEGATAVPAAIKQAMFLMIAHWYENREAVTIASAAIPIPFGADRLLSPYRVMGL